MRKFSAVLASSLFLFACGRSGDGGSTTPDKTVTSISLSPATFALAIGGTQALSVAAVFSDNSTAVITTATFTSSAPAVATVSDTGVVTAVTAGTAVITAKQDAATATANVTVNAAGPATSLVVFDDNFGNGVSFAPFSGGVPPVDTTQHEVGSASLKVVDTSTAFVGGAFKLAPAVDASNFNVITFWAMASANHTINTFGLGNDTSDKSLEADWNAVPLTTTWTKFTLPLPNPAKLAALTGAFLYSVDAANFTFWLDQIQYEKITLAAPTAVLPTQTVNKGVGDKITLSGLTATWQINSAAETLTVAPKYFTFISSNTAVATVDTNGVITCVANGAATITASLGSVAATGSVTVNVAAGNAPTTAAPTPTQDASTVISLFSDAYTNHAVGSFNKFSGNNGETVETDIQIAGNNVKEYAPLQFVGIDFSGANLIDATSMTFVHVDYWTPDATTFGIKLVDFGSNGTFDGPPTDPAGEIDLTPVKGQWTSLELPLTQFVSAGLSTRAHLAQIIFVGSESTLYIDNLYLHSGPAGSGGTGIPDAAPTTAPPRPTAAAGTVISMLSDAYTNVFVNDWNDFGNGPSEADLLIAGDHMKQYGHLTFAGVNITGGDPAKVIDATSMTFFHLDYWTPDATTLKIKLVDFGSDGVFQGSGADSEFELTFTPTKSQWVQLDIPLSQFTGLASRSHLAQLILSGSNSTLYVDNVYFHQ